MAVTQIPLAVSRSLSDELRSLYQKTRRKVGTEDLEHIRRVAAYSRAIERRSRELIEQGRSFESWRRGVLLRGVHILLEFSELGHMIYHGCYNHLPDAGEFHSEKWQWDFVTDPREWKVMHHQNHHPFTNILQKDHDYGYSFLRAHPKQPWRLHNVGQPVFVPFLLLVHLYFFSVYTATSAARVEGRRILGRDTFRRTFELVGAHLKEQYWSRPRGARSGFLRTLLGDYAGSVFGHDYTILVLLLEHHGSGVTLFDDPGPHESTDAYYRRQILGTTNFIPHPGWEQAIGTILKEEVRFDDPPGQEVLYGGLQHHIEHHLFPDLPPNRLREISSEVRAICKAHGLPYQEVPIGQAMKNLFESLPKMAWPNAPGEEEDLRGALRRPRALLRRFVNGVLYRTPEAVAVEGSQVEESKDVAARVLAVLPHRDGMAVTYTLERPREWGDAQWEPGSFLSVKVFVGDQPHVRQYSLNRASDLRGELVEITVKRVPGGLVSERICDTWKVGDRVTLVGRPVNEGPFVLKEVPPKMLLIAGGVGITPLLATIRKLRRLAQSHRPQVTLLYFNRDEQSILFEEELREAGEEPWLSVHFYCDTFRGTPPTDVKRGMFTGELLQRVVPEAATWDVYACAPTGLMEVARTELLKQGLDPSRYHTESFVPGDQTSVPVDGRMFRVRFRRSGVEALVRADRTLLSAAREAGISVPTGCLRGLCKTCSCTKFKGTTQFDLAGESTGARITMCNTFPRSDMELDV